MAAGTKTSLPGTVEAAAVPVVAAWTGREVASLRLAYRMSKREFAERLGMTHRVVALWENQERPISPVGQQALDTMLDRADRQTVARFLLATGQAGCPCRIGHHRLPGEHT
ncbi:helix-turn-helix domain-containing protein [Phytohabitans rumicis]|uniref:HTH cro/C1-type domain-containing protein n=1 Tax=Phytohabitans rumicis TaxID=1076125 RepID=A0A6V8KX22_9ACTN|nr:helix-turn-helix transcriptional regulator [Phytohabitans rumicis]GFJ86387.1 hypothetical protein Prum_000290 [Phytohabitans rumicis]